MKGGDSIKYIFISDIDVDMLLKFDNIGVIPYIVIGLLLMIGSIIGAYSLLKRKEMSDE